MSYYIFLPSVFLNRNNEKFGNAYIILVRKPDGKETTWKTYTGERIILK
jgi:hypothetical protein